MGSKDGESSWFSTSFHLHNLGQSNQWSEEHASHIDIKIIHKMRRADRKKKGGGKDMQSPSPGKTDNMGHRS